MDLEDGTGTMRQCYNALNEFDGMELAKSYLNNKERYHHQSNHTSIETANLLRQRRCRDRFRLETLLRCNQEGSWKTQ